ncbi:hypothetical protein PanWU01x14_300620, partial [Parasponia andersonii]
MAKPRNWLLKTILAPPLPLHSSRLSDKANASGSSECRLSVSVQSQLFRDIISHSNGEKSDS